VGRSAAVEVLKLGDTRAATAALLRRDERHAGLVLEHAPLHVVEFAPEALRATGDPMAARLGDGFHVWLLEVGVNHTVSVG
jgi:hypothetical protein